MKDFSEKEFSYACSDTEIDKEIQTDKHWNCDHLQI